MARSEEIALAKKIEVTRKRFRRTVIGCAMAMRATVGTLVKVHKGDLPFDRTIKVSLTERLTKEQIIARMPHNLNTLSHLMEENQKDFRLLLNRRTSAGDAAGRPQAVHPPAAEDAHADRGVESADPPGAGHDAADGGLGGPDGRNPPPTAAAGRQPGHAGQAGQSAPRTPRPDGSGPGEPQKPPHALRNHAPPVPGLRAGQAAALRRQPAAGGLDRQEIPQSGAELPGPHPGGEHRA